MSKVLVEKSSLTGISGVIREKLNVSTTYKPSQMPAAIRSIQSGITPTGTKSITENGTYDVTNYASVLINVSGGGGSDLITGSVIFYAGTTAPSGYLVCDGTVYNIADYADLASFFNTNYGSVNYWGGNGTTTFAVPDWRGEFFRAAGTNSRAGQGSGGTVGEHQNQTMQNRLAAQKNQNYIQLQGNTSGWLSVDDADAYETSDTHYWMTTTASQSGLDKNAPQRYAARPTNTSLLVCIKT